MIRKRIPRVFLVVTVFVLSVMLTGCGSLGEKRETRQQEAQGEATFTADDYVTVPGSNITYFQNRIEDEDDDRHDTVPVSFDLEGPWDFREGPDEEESVLTVLAEDDAPEASAFPTADVIERHDTGTKRVYTYLINDDDGLKTVGEAVHSSTAAGPEIYTFSPALVSIDYPLSGGSTWTCSYQSATSGGGAVPEDVDETRRVVAVNRLVTPHDSYDRSFMVQIKRKINGSSGPATWIEYRWYVPGLGVAAVISSVKNEAEEVFTRAEVFMRLKHSGE